MAVLGEYAFLATNLLTGSVIEEVELQSFSWTEIFNRPGSGRATARVHNPKTTQENFASWQNGLWAIKDGAVKFGGIMAGVQPRKGTGVIDIPLMSFMDYISAQITNDITAMTNATQVGKDIIWTNKDQFLIAADLVNHSQTGTPNRNLGVTVAYDSLSGILM